MILRSTPLLAGTLLTACAALASIDPPPQEWTGWQVRGPSGESPVIVEPGAPVGPEPLFAAAFAEALSMPPADEPRGPVVLGFGLATNLPVSTSSMVSEIARCLDYNWFLCYLFVRDNIRFTPYKGISRGPERTLIDREGNDADQALLLFALLRASGYSLAEVRYSVMDMYGRFRVPLAGGDNDYDAAHWLGVPADGTVAELTNAVSRVLSSSGIGFGFAIGATPQECQLAVEHFCVYLPDATNFPYLDPSFKPRKVPTPSVSLLDDMGSLLSKTAPIVLCERVIS